MLASPATPTPRVGTASGTPTTTCRTPGTARRPTATAFECWSRARRASPRHRPRSASAHSSRRRRVHHPAVLAKRAATSITSAAAAAVLGVGAGWQVNEHQAIRRRAAATGRTGAPVRGGDRDRATARRRRVTDGIGSTVQGDDPARAVSSGSVLVGTASPRWQRPPSGRRVEHVGDPDADRLRGPTRRRSAADRSAHAFVDEPPGRSCAHTATSPRVDGGV